VGSTGRGFFYILFSLLEEVNRMSGDEELLVVLDNGGCWLMTVIGVSSLCFARRGRGMRDRRKRGPVGSLVAGAWRQVLYGQLLLSSRGREEINIF
jgi:hypothetical protein